ncbi:hypothetical protein JOD82_002072 [Paenibacillus sp. 1182]|uniref:hypothetical protein n=1 Tax=Paenibacillus sp. 1182 TaxID=2806565 RepID=UPI001B58FF7D|nr:hypothetical protein [Paenibacillus sp. 1182]MBP1309052.1 hypothetical protein [Paenibacillus sp. 1182]
MDLDQKVFLPEFRIDEDTTRRRLEKNSFTDIAVFQGEALMGYVSLYPIPRNIYTEIHSGYFDESRVERSTLPYQRIGVYDTYLCGIAIDKEQFPRFKVKFLIMQLEKHLQNLKKKGFFVNRIIAHAVSVPGRKTLEKMRFTERYPNIFVYFCFRQGYLFIKDRQEDYSSNRKTNIHPKMVYV